MAGERKAIRDSVKAALATVFAGVIETARRVDARDSDEYINVFLEAGDVDFEGLDGATTATLVVGYHVRALASDDALDEIADQLHAALGSEPIAPGVLRGIVPAGFEYADDQEQEFTSLYLQYSVTY